MPDLNRKLNDRANDVRTKQKFHKTIASLYDNLSIRREISYENSPSFNNRHQEAILLADLPASPNIFKITKISECAINAKT